VRAASRAGESDDDASRQIGAHCGRHRGLSRLGRPRLGRACGVLLPPGADRGRGRDRRPGRRVVLPGGNLSPGEREDRDNRWVIAAFGLIGLLDAWLAAWTDHNEIWTIDGDTVRWLGVALFVAGGALRIWPVFVLGHRFSGLVAIQPGHALLTGGLYGVIRHPSYLGLLVNSLGWGLAFRSGAGVLLTALLILPLVARIRAEDRLLRSHFGDAYEAYCARTSRLIPGLY
jgi:protein-S-isoprenylcysteine O-methyltransferase Ste14